MRWSAREHGAWNASHDAKGLLPGRWESFPDNLAAKEVDSVV